MGYMQRFGFAFAATIALSIAGIIYARVFTTELAPLATETHSGPFDDPVIWMDQLIPVIIVILLLAVWLWVIAAGVQEEKTVQRRRM